MLYTLGVITGGGDAPGLNAYLHAIDLAGRRRGWRVVGIRNGFDGLLRPDRHPGGGVVDLSSILRSGDETRSGTLLGAASSGFPALDPVMARDLAAMLRAAGIDALVVAGGDGTQRIAAMLARVGFPVIGLPKTIDNDLDGAPTSIGFDSAVAFLVDAAVALRHHADAHRRVVLLETMGRNSGHLALATALAAAADGALLPEIPYDPLALRVFVTDRLAAGASSVLLVVAEGAYQHGSEEPGTSGLGGVSSVVAAGLGDLGVEVRTAVPAQLQRGAAVSAADRLLAARLGATAVDAVDAGEFGILLAWAGDTVTRVPLAAVGQVRRLSEASADVAAARALGLFLGA
jgi:6-phosphofructokinase 1